MRSASFIAMFLGACSSGGASMPEHYAFEGRTGASSVAYDGQVFRNLLVGDLARYVDGLTERIDADGLTPARGAVTNDLGFYLSFDDAVGADLEHGLSLDPTPLQTTYRDVSSGKDLLGKLAGNDPVGQHADWSSEFAGWGTPGSTTPQALVDAWVDELDQLATDRGNGTLPTGPDGQPVDRVTLTADGRDLGQLLEKFLRGAVAFSQGTDDYLDDDEPGKGLLADHTEVVEGEAYTELEHQWDEGFGYFGAARSWPAHTLDQISDDRGVDGDGDGALDLLTEVSFGHAVNAAKRDRGAPASPDLVGRAWAGFAGGRALLDRTDGPLSDDELDELRAYRDEAVAAWEAVIAASVVHYINEVLVDTAAIGTDAYDFGDHAKHWSEAKGFALALQFNPRSPLDDATFQRLHVLLRDAPVLQDSPEAELASAMEDLREARALLGDAYEFDAINLGDADGQNGW